MVFASEASKKNSLEKSGLLGHRLVTNVSRDLSLKISISPCTAAEYELS